MRAWGASIFRHAKRAQYLSEHFVPVLLDRDEHPHADSALVDFASHQAGSSGAGWPYAVFLDPETRAPLAAALPATLTVLPVGASLAPEQQAKYEAEVREASQSDPDAPIPPPTVRGLMSQAKAVAEAWAGEASKGALRAAGARWIEAVEGGTKQESTMQTDTSGGNAKDVSNSAREAPHKKSLAPRARLAHLAARSHAALMGQHTTQLDPLFGGEGSMPKMPRPVRIRALLAAVAARCDAIAGAAGRVRAIEAWREARARRRERAAAERIRQLQAAEAAFEAREHELEEEAREQEAARAGASGTVAQVAFMITASMKLDLLDRGYTANDIKHMKPAEAQDILSRPPGAPAPSEGEEGGQSVGGSDGVEALKAGRESRREEALGPLERELVELEAAEAEQAARDDDAVRVAREQQSVTSADARVAALLQGTDPGLLQDTRGLLADALRSDPHAAVDALPGRDGRTRAAWGGLLESGEGDREQGGPDSGASSQSTDGAALPSPMLRRGGGVHVLQARLAEAWFSMRRMLQGGWHDHARGGFYRYSRSRRWHLPSSCEVMAEDQGDIAMMLLEGYQCTKDPVLANAAGRALERCLRDFRTEGGGFYSGLGPRASAEGAKGSQKRGGSGGTGAAGAGAGEDPTREQLLGAMREQAVPPAAPPLLPSLWSTDEVQKALEPLLEHPGGLDEHGLPVRLTNRG